MAIAPRSNHRCEDRFRRIRAFVENGGTLLALGDASEIAIQARAAGHERVVDENDKPLPRAKYYVPGSVLSVAVDTTDPIAWGMPPRTDIFFDNNPAFRLESGRSRQELSRVAWFDSPTPLRSGWAWGQKVLDGPAKSSAPLGKGQWSCMDPRCISGVRLMVPFRFLFNGIYSSQLTDSKHHENRPLHRPYCRCALAFGGSRPAPKGSLRSAKSRAGGSRQAAKITLVDATLVREMHDRYADNWYSTLRFEQSNTFYT